MWDLVPWKGVKPRSPALRARSLSQWTTRTSPTCQLLQGLHLQDAWWVIPPGRNGIKLMRRCSQSTHYHRAWDIIAKRQFMIFVYRFVLSCFSRVQLCNPMACSLPGSSVHGILQARILEWVATPCFRGSSQPRDRAQVSCGSSITGGFFTTKPPGVYVQLWYHVQSKCCHSI